MPLEASAKTDDAMVPVWRGWVDPVAMNQSVLDAFRAYCQKSGLSQAELAERAGVDRRWVHRVLTEVKMCTLDMLGHMGNCMHCDPWYLVFVLGKPRPSSSRPSRR